MIRSKHHITCSNMLKMEGEVEREPQTNKQTKTIRGNTQRKLIVFNEIR